MYKTRWTYVIVLVCGQISASGSVEPLATSATNLQPQSFDYRGKAPAPFGTASFDDGVTSLPVDERGVLPFVDKCRMPVYESERSRVQQDIRIRHIWNGRRRFGFKPQKRFVIQSLKLESAGNICELSFPGIFQYVFYLEFAASSRNFTVSRFLQ